MSQCVEHSRGHHATCQEVVEWEECPICGVLVEVADLPAHCNEHFEDSPEKACPSDLGMACPVDGCDAKIAPWALEDHLQTHRYAYCASPVRFVYVTATALLHP